MLFILFYLTLATIWKIGKGRENMRTQIRGYYFLFQERNDGSLDKTNGRSDENKQIYLRGVWDIKEKRSGDELNTIGWHGMGSGQE